jgi:DNA-binding winged helix-turn-helix (wHTH) protein/tetratricopeptide (TPR) repeat protein
MRYRLGDYLLDLDTGELIGPEGPIELRRRTFQLLAVLVARAPALVSRDELLDEVWGRTALSPNALSQTISELRQALGDSAREARYIETRHGRGYRLKVDAQPLIQPLAEPVSVENEIDTPRVPPAKPPRPERALWPLALIASLGLIAVLAFSELRLEMPGPPSRSAATEVLAIGRFGQGPEVPDWVPPAAFELIWGRLANESGLVVIRDDEPTADRRSADARRWAVMREVHGAGLALDGVWQQSGTGQLELEMSLIQLDSGRLLDQWRFAETPEHLDALVDAAVTALRRALALPSESIGRPALADAGQSEQYWRGLAALAEGDHETAVELLRSLYLAHDQPAWLALQLARALRLSGASTEAAELFGRIGDGSLALGPGESLRLRAELAWLRNDVAEVATALRALSALFPQDLDLLLELAEVELDSLQASAARATLAGAAARDGADARPEFHRLRARLALLDADYDQALASAEQALELARRYRLIRRLIPAVQTLASVYRARGDLLAAETRISQARQDWAGQLTADQDQRLVLELVSLRRARGELAEAAQLVALMPPSDGDSPIGLRAEIERAMLDHDRGDLHQALARLERIWPAVQRLGRADHQIAFGSVLGVVLIARGDMASAVEAFEDAMALARRSGQGHRMAALQINFGQMLARQGRHAEAEAVWRHALDVFEAVGDRRGMAICLGNLAASASEQGLGARSRELNQRALALFRELDLPADTARTAFNLALSASRSGDLAGAEALLAEAEAIFRATGQNDLVLYVSAMRADQRLLAGDWAGAAELLDALDGLLAQGSPLRQALVWSARGRWYQWSGELDRAATAYARAAELRDAAGHEGWIMTSRLEQLRLALLAGQDPLMVEMEAGAVAEWFAGQQQIRAAARAWLLVAEALLSQGDAGKAAIVLERVRSSGEGFEDIALSLDLAWAEAWAGPSEGRPTRLSHLARRAAELGYGGKLGALAAAAELNGFGLNVAAIPTARSSLPPYARGTADRP